MVGSFAVVVMGVAGAGRPGFAVDLKAEVVAELDLEYMVAVLDFLQIATSQEAVQAVACLVPCVYCRSSEELAYRFVESKLRQDVHRPPC